MSEKKPGLLRRLASGIGRAIRVFTGLVRGLFALVLILVLINLFGSGLEPLPGNALLRVAPEGILVEQLGPPTPRGLLAPNTGPAPETLVGDLVKAIDAAAADTRIRGIALQTDDLLGGGMDKLDTLGAALQRFRATGKPVIAIADSYDQTQYYLASFADEIHLNPLGHVLLNGFGSYRLYFREAAERLRINFHVFRAGTYKDAVEPFTETGMSPASREHTSAWLAELWQHYRAGVTTRRGLAENDLDAYIDQLGTKLAAADGDSAELALREGLVDTLSTRIEIRSRLLQQLGAGVDDRGEDHTQVSVQRYLKHLRGPPDPDTGKPRIGVLIATGTIYDGEQATGAIGGDSLARLIRRAREKDHLRALVVRVDSPGGSAFAADVIRRELLATQAAGIPVVISMGSVAASGGYWIAAEADEIWAEPTTLTGSIGVFGLLPTFEDTLSGLGIRSDGVGTHALSGTFRLSRPLEPQAEQVIQASVDHLYNRFIALVAAGRDRAPEEIDQIAQGRVWTGQQAQRLGLVDQVGGLPEAVAAAARLAGVDTYRQVPVEPALDLRQQLLRRLLESELLPGVESGALRQLAALLEWSRPLYGDLDAWGPGASRTRLILQCLECNRR